MAVASVQRRGAPRAGRGQPPGRLARWAVSLSAAFGTAFVVAIAVIAAAYAVGHGSAVEDTAFAATLTTIAAAGLLGSFAGFLAAIVAKAKHERWVLLWLPLAVFPALVAFLALGEAFLWE